MRARLGSALAVASIAGGVACSEPPPSTESGESEAPTIVASAAADPEPEEAAVERSWPELPPPAEPAGDRLYAKMRFVWIRPQPRVGVEWIGYLSMGESVALRGGDAKAADAGPGHSDGCARWYAIEPRGFVCAGDEATLDRDDADMAELGKRVAKDEPLPYAYAESTGTAVYLDVPPRRRQYFRESAFDEHMAAVERARGLPAAEVEAIDPDLVGVDLEPTGRPLPPVLLHLGSRGWPRYTDGKDGFPEVFRGSTVAYTYDFDAADRSWVLTWDRGMIPKDRLKPYRQSSFHGVRLGDGVDLPIAFFRTAQAGFERYAHVALSGEEREVGGERFLLTRSGALVRAADLSVPRLRSDRPPSATGARTWIDISITGGWLVAYEGDRPVYTTMVAPGRGGLPVEGKTLLETASTPLGDFTIRGKFHTATMTSNFSDKIVHAEVPYTQNFSGPYALHTAYWHDDWGIGKSGGCVNLAPIDGMRLFHWTRPQLPAGWHAMRDIEADTEHYADATVISIHE
jgi:L,D-transpeptidase-like protein